MLDQTHPLNTSNPFCIRKILRVFEQPNHDKLKSSTQQSTNTDPRQIMVAFLFTAVNIKTETPTMMRHHQRSPPKFCTQGHLRTRLSALAVQSRRHTGTRSTKSSLQPTKIGSDQGSTNTSILMVKRSSFGKAVGLICRHILIHHITYLTYRVQCQLWIERRTNMICT